MTAFMTEPEFTKDLLIIDTYGEHHKFNNVKFKFFVDPLENKEQDMIVIDDETNTFLGEYFTKSFISDNEVCFG